MRERSFLRLGAAASAALVALPVACAQLLAPPAAGYADDAAADAPAPDGGADAATRCARIPSCDAGTCGQVFNPTQHAIALEVWRGYVYWLEDKGQILRQPVDGAASDDELLTTDEGADSLAIDDSGLYWSNPDKGLVQRCGLAPPCAPVVLSSELYHPSGLALDPAAVYVGSTLPYPYPDAAPDAGFVLLPKDGGPFVRIAPDLGVTLAVDPKNVYVATRTCTVGEIPKSGGAGLQHLYGPLCGSVMAVDSEALYALGDYFYRYPLASGAGVASTSSVRLDARDMTLDCGGDLVWIADGRLARIARSALASVDRDAADAIGDSEILAGGFTDGRAVASGPTGLFWATEAAIYLLPR